MSKPTPVSAETVKRLREDYPSETDGLSDESVLELYEYHGKYEEPSLWGNLGDATDDYRQLADEYLKLAEAARKASRQLEDIYLESEDQEHPIIVECTDIANALREAVNDE